MTYTIVKDFIPDLPRIHFRFDKPEGVVLHATDNWNDSPPGERAFESRTFQNAFVHGFIGKDINLQVADTRYIAYGAGHIANQRFLHLELCQYHDPDDFKASYDRWTWNAAYWLKTEVGKPPVEGETLWSHKLVTERLGGTTHQDPDAYLQFFGVTWAETVKKVQEWYDMLEKQPFVMNRADAKTIIATWISPSWFDAERAYEAAMKAGDKVSAAAYDKQMAYYRYLANQIRFACGAKEDEEL